LIRYEKRHQATLVVVVLALAAFNLTFNLGRESVTEWDESLYANSALDMLDGGGMVVTTVNGEVDYFNAKPPLNVWLIAGSLHVFGRSLLAMRAAAIAAAWLTVVVLLVWGWRRIAPAAGLFAALVLTTSFGFLHVHSGRTANPDALLGLLLLLTVITLEAAATRPWRRVWLGPLLAGVFFLKGMAVGLPVLLVGITEIRRRMTGRDRWIPLAAATSLAMVPVAMWAVARWRVDREVFFERMFFQDFIALSTTAPADQRGSLLFYVNVLLKHQYDWLAAVTAVGLLYPPHSWRNLAGRLAFWRSHREYVVVLGSWMALVFLVPSLMQTKAAWYINPVYPTFALAIGAALHHGFSQAVRGPRDRRWLLTAAVAMAVVVAEAKVLWYSEHYRRLEHTTQGVLLAEAERLRGARIYNTSWDLSELFVVRGLLQAEPQTITVEEFITRAGPQDFIVLAVNVTHPLLMRIAVKGNYGLYRRRGSESRAEER
jgi:4-amino-4-deoxy-L-arabinose transferase-like glycosyltransferase